MKFFVVLSTFALAVTSAHKYKSPYECYYEAIEPHRCDYKAAKETEMPTNNETIWMSIYNEVQCRDLCVGLWEDGDYPLIEQFWCKSYAFKEQWWANGDSNCWLFYTPLTEDAGVPTGSEAHLKQGKGPKIEDKDFHFFDVECWKCHKGH